MTRQVDWAAQERVDLPDMTAMTEFMMQDVRRHIRRLITGNAARVVRGFQIQASATPDSRVTVKLDPGGGADLGAFVAALNYGSTYDFGMLGGDKDALGNLDGASQNILDFTAQSPGTYTVKLRMTFVEGNSDRRAFWNETSLTEQIQTTSTRLLPQWEVSFSASGSDWLTLGTVVWGGSTITASNITDARNLALEGTPHPTGTTAQLWSHANAAAASAFGVGDFDRGTDRGTSPTAPHGVADLWAGFRALARQVQDIKGARDLDQRLDWFSRPLQPAGFLSSGDALTTKSLRTLDVITFTCADGVTDSGDFNGLTSINDCFTFIANNAAALPAKIRIVVKNRATADGAPAFTWSVPVTIDSVNITLLAEGNGTQSFFSGIDVSATVLSLASMGAGTTALTLTRATLRVEGFDIDATSAPDTVNVFDLDQASRFRCRNLSIGMVSADPAKGFALRTGHTGLRIEDSVFDGVVWIGGSAMPAGYPVAGVPLKNDTTVDIGGSIEGTLFTVVRFRHKTIGGASDADQWLFANGVTCRNCSFDDYLGPFGSSSQAQGNVDLTGARRIQFEKCAFAYGGETDSIRISSVTYNTGKYVASKKITFDDCDFALVNSGAHATSSGANTTEGTGWAIKACPTVALATPLSQDQIPRHITVRNCRFEVAALAPGGSFPYVFAPADAGAVSVLDCSDVFFENNSVTNWTQAFTGLGSGEVALTQFAASTAGAALGGGQNHYIEDNFCGQFRQRSSTNLYGDIILFEMKAIALNAPCIARNTFQGLDNTNLLHNGGTYALDIKDCVGPSVEDNRFQLFRDPTADTSSVTMVLSGVTSLASFARNKFYACGDTCIIARAAAAMTRLHFDANLFFVGTDNTKFLQIIDFTNAASIDHVHFKHNDWDYEGGGGAVTAITMKNPTYFSCDNNFLASGVIHHSTAGGTATAHSYGYGVATVSSLNKADSYT